ncbi:hypothetical protein J6590_012323 [Homalodisca vitripennis]|nr:hypothetical protein J6590_012323 [Homalodisca vitripennis]
MTSTFLSGLHVVMMGFERADKRIDLKYPYFCYCRMTSMMYAEQTSKPLDMEEKLTCTFIQRPPDQPSQPCLSCCLYESSILRTMPEFLDRIKTKTSCLAVLSHGQTLILESPHQLDLLGREYQYYPNRMCLWSMNVYVRFNEYTQKAFPGRYISHLDEDLFIKEIVEK